jgi:putative transcriptional regulator
MPSDFATFKKDLLKSVKQMCKGQAARVTKVEVRAAAEAHARAGFRQHARPVAS